MSAFFVAWSGFKDPDAEVHRQFWIQLDPSVNMTSAIVEEVDETSTTRIVGSDLVVGTTRFAPESGGQPGSWLVDFEVSVGSANTDGSPKTYYLRLTFTTDGPIVTDQRTARLRVAQT